jgi:hypothetical protein
MTATNSRQHGVLMFTRFEQQGTGTHMIVSHRPSPGFQSRAAAMKTWVETGSMTCAVDSRQGAEEDSLK